MIILYFKGQSQLLIEKREIGNFPIIMINHYLSNNNLFSTYYIANGMHKKHVIANLYNTNITLIFDMIKVGVEDII